VPLEPEQLRVPIRNYLDADRWQLEVDRVFRRVPLVLAMSCELAAPHAFKTIEVLGVPVLLVRGKDGVVRSFVNSCSHRGAVVELEASGVARRFTCPYHSWSYDGEGALVGVFDRERFGEVDTSCLGLLQLPVAERAGLVLGGVAPDVVDVDTFLCGYDALLEHHRLADCHHVGRTVLDGPSWKLCYDGYIDFYHLPILHRRTFGADYSNTTCADAWGPHQRLTQPDQRMLALDALPEDEWPLDKLTGGVWTIFPHVSLARFPVGPGHVYQLAQLFPGPTPGTSTTILNYLSTFEPTDDLLGDIDKQIDFLRDVVRDEDYFTTGGIQRAMAARPDGEFLLGRNEGTGQRFHGWLDRLVAAETPADTAALFAAATEYHQP